MQLLAVRTATVRLPTLALMFDQRTRKHLAKRPQAANQLASKIQVTIEGHHLSAINSSGRSLLRQDSPEICKNDVRPEGWQTGLSGNNLAFRRRGALRNRCCFRMSVGEAPV